MSEIKLKKGDKVVMHTCLESKGKNLGKVWTCHTDSFKCEAGIEVVFLEGFSGFFHTKFLQPVKLDSFCNERINSLEASLLDVSTQATKRIEELENENALFKGRNEGFEKQIMGLLIKYEEFYKRFPDLKSAMDKAEEVLKENAELKAKVGLSIDCEKAQKNGELCLGYGGDEDEPCEQCKNCIKCETGYYQLGETKKDEELNKLQTQIEKMKCCENCKHHYFIGDELECRLLDKGINCDDREKWELAE